MAFPVHSYGIMISFNKNQLRTIFQSRETKLPFRWQDQNLSVLDVSSSLGNENRSSNYESSSSGNENRSSDYESNSSRNDANAKKMLVDMAASDIGNDDIRPSYDSDSDISSDIPNMYPDRGKEEYDDVNYEQQRAFFASLINNLKCDVEKCNKTFAKENEKFDEYVQPLLNRKNELEKKNQESFKQINDLDNRLQKAGQTDQTLRMLLPKEDNVNMGKQRLGFENQNNDVNPSLLNKAKELAPCLYNIDEEGTKMMLSGS
ncbi:hypothetical protein Tco_0862733 [Tanacetum coccineum]